MFTGITINTEVTVKNNNTAKVATKKITNNATKKRFTKKTNEDLVLAFVDTNGRVTVDNVRCKTVGEIKANDCYFFGVCTSEGLMFRKVATQKEIVCYELIAYFDTEYVEVFRNNLTLAELRELLRNYDTFAYKACNGLLTAEQICGSLNRKDLVGTKYKIKQDMEDYRGRNGFGETKHFDGSNW